MINGNYIEFTPQTSDEHHRLFVFLIYKKWLKIRIKQILSHFLLLIYSTVTDLARFLGLSILQFLARAI